MAEVINFDSLINRKNSVTMLIIEQMKSLENDYIKKGKLNTDSYWNWILKVKEHWNELKIADEHLLNEINDFLILKSKDKCVKDDFYSIIANFRYSYTKDLIGL